MQQTCSKCGFQTETTAKFCRQCGAPLVISEPSEAQTQHYGRQTPAPPVPDAASAPFTTQMPQQPPSIADTFTPDTGRLPNTPPGPPPFAGQYAPNNAYPAPTYGQPPAPIGAKSNWWKWALGIVLGSVLLCGGCITWGIYKTQQVAQQVASGTLPPGIQAAIDRAKKEAEEAARKAQQDAANQQPQYGPDGKVIPPPPPPPPAPGAEVSPEMAKLKYPNATDTNHVKAMGQEIVNMASSDNLETVKAFYQKAMGEPTIESNSPGDKSVIFQKGNVTVTLNMSGESPDRTDITVINSTLIPNLKQIKP